MPLSEDEQRILRQIEEQLQRDPSFGRDIKPRHVGSRRAVIVSSVATVLCLVLDRPAAGRQPVPVVRRVHRCRRRVGDRRASRRRLGEAGLNHLSDSVRSRLGGSAGNRGE